MSLVTIKHNDGSIVVHSNYDSGKHLGFKVGYTVRGEYTSTSIDELLTKEQIKTLEYTLAALTKDFLEANK